MVTRQGPRRPPVRVRRRGVGDVLAGICALVALAVLMAGVPVALLALFGSPLPDEMPAASDLTNRVGPGALIDILVALVWLAWIQLAACVVVEVYAGVRGVGVPARVPLAGGTQSLVHRLVVAALLLFSATSVIVPALSGGGLSQRPRRRHRRKRRHSRRRRSSSDSRPPRRPSPRRSPTAPRRPPPPSR